MLDYIAMEAIDKVQNLKEIHEHKVDNANHFYTVMEHEKNFQVLSNF